MNTTVGSTLIKETQYYYDAIGRRITKIHVDGNDNSKSFERRYVYDGQEILFELNGNNDLLTIYTHSTLVTDDVLAMDKNNTSYFLLKDHLGTINEIIDVSGNLVQRYVYSPFGKILKLEDASGQELTSPIIENIYTFTGRELDSESGQYYFRARYYDPSLGRFLSSDPDAGAVLNPITHINKYAYVGNNSTNNIDPDGKKFFSKSTFRGMIYTAVLVGAVVLTGGAALGPILIGAGLGATIGYFAGGKSIDAALKGALYGALAGAMGPVASMAAGPSIGLGIFYGAIAGGLTAAVGAKLIEGKKASWKSIAVGATAGGFFGAYSSSVPQGSAAANVMEANASMVGPTTDAALAPKQPTKWNFEPN